MIAKGNLHPNGKKLADYLTTGKEGERAELVELRGFASDNIRDAFTDIEIQAEEILKTKESLIQVMARCTGQTTERIREDSERDRFFDAPQAVKYGICDEILGENTDPKIADQAADGHRGGRCGCGCAGQSSGRDKTPSLFAAPKSFVPRQSDRRE